MAKLETQKLKVGFIGGGNMASAIGAGLIKKGILKPDNVWVSGKTERTFDFWNNLGVHTTLKNGEVVDNSNIIFLAIKPHILHEAINDIKRTMTRSCENKLYVSVIMSISLEMLHRELLILGGDPRIIRSMPSTPMMVGEGITVYCSRDTTPEDITTIDTLFSYLGVSKCVPESIINAIGGLSGCGPAYAYLITEALADGAVKMGVPRAMATQFAAQVLVGAGKMVLETGKHPGQLKDEVCSPGGNTITGIHALERGQVRGSIMNAVEAAVSKANEVATKFK